MDRSKGACSSRVDSICKLKLSDDNILQSSSYTSILFMIVYRTSFNIGHLIGTNHRGRHTISLINMIVLKSSSIYLCWLEDSPPLVVRVTPMPRTSLANHIFERKFRVRLMPKLINFGSITANYDDVVQTKPSQTKKHRI